MSEPKNVLTNQIIAEQSKFVYFLLAAAASGIAFAIQRTTDHPSGCWSLLYFGPAGLAWVLSFAMGCWNRFFAVRTMWANVVLWRVKDGSYDNMPDTPERVAWHNDFLQRVAEGAQSRATRWGKWQFRLLWFGGLLFIIGHIIEMATQHPPA